MTSEHCMNEENITSCVGYVLLEILDILCTIDELYVTWTSPHVASKWCKTSELLMQQYIHWRSFDTGLNLRVFQKPCERGKYYFLFGVHVAGDDTL